MTLFNQARHHELNGNMEEATGLYEAVVKQNPMHTVSYNRLMILRRRMSIMPRKSL
jgi:hypothetical protein